LGFEIGRLFAGVFHKFRPDFPIRLFSGMNPVVEMNGRNTPRDETKQRYHGEWAGAVNAHGGFGRWNAGRCLNSSDLPAVIHAASNG